MFVCTGNICRSPLAHRLLEKELDAAGLNDQVHVESSGIGAWHIGEDADSRMRRTAAKHGVALHHPARQLTSSDVADYDLLFAMDKGHYREILSLSGEDIREKLFVFRQFDPEVTSEAPPIPRKRAPDVPDPYYGGAQGFEDVYAMVERTCRVIVDHIAQGALP
jgi:protein-tyrosine phosphatase